jgi:hypothetical protein
MMSLLYVTNKVKQRVDENGGVLDTIVFSSPNGVVVDVEDGHEDAYSAYKVDEDTEILLHSLMRPVPSKISMRQARLVLLDMNLLDAVSEAVSANKAWEIEWEYATELERGNPLVLAIGSMLAMDADALDTMFYEASLK